MCLSNTRQKLKKIHREVYEPLMQMIAAARADGVRLSIVSAYRSYDHQRRIWERKWGNNANNDTKKALDILRWSSFPGTSRHHWGTDVDFNSVETGYWNSAEGKKVYRWLKQNAADFGFCQTYDSGRTQGYNEEPWHWSHLPTADKYYAQITNPAVLDIALTQKIKGAVAVRQLGVMMNYVTGINHCQVNQSRVKQGSQAAHKQAEPVQIVDTAAKPQSQPLHQQQPEMPQQPTIQHVQNSNVPKPPLGDLESIAIQNPDK
ncbi:M15 family metallopeptidase [Moraxella sp. ZJ142]|uniref:M15 family metallopeptidase n=1 Tax=Moraxella marmotae TaxID=3344520 RepID=UPI0035D42D61